MNMNNQMEDTTNVLEKYGRDITSYAKDGSWIPLLGVMKRLGV